MKKLLSFILLSATISLIGMDEQQIASTLDGFSQRIFSSIKNHTRIDALKSVGGIAMLHVVHKSGKPFSPYAYITPLGTVVAKGGTNDFHKLMSQVVYREGLAVQDNNHLVSFQALVSVGHVLKSCYTVAKELAAVIPDGQSVHWVCKPIGLLVDTQMIVVADSEIPRIKEWAQQNNLLGELKEDDLVSLDKFADWDGKKIYPRGWISIEEKEARLMRQGNSEKQPPIKAQDSEDLEEITI